MLRTLTSLAILTISLFSIGCAGVGLQRPVAALRSAAISGVTPEGFTIDFDVDLTNPNAVAVPLGKTDYRLALGGVRVLDGTATPDATLPANGTTSVKLPVAVTFENLLAAEQAIRSGGGDIAYALDGGLSVGGGPALLGQSVRVPLEFKGTLKLREILNDPLILLKSPTARKLAGRALGPLFGG